MAESQQQNAFQRRSNTSTRTYPGSAARVPARPAPGLAARRAQGSESVPTVFVRPLSRSQLTPVHGYPEAFARGGQQAHLPPPVAPRPISLDQPRPDSERHRNLYLGAPIALTANTNAGARRGGEVLNNLSKSVVDSSLSVTAADQVRLPTNLRSKQKSHNTVSSNASHVDVVTVQPSKRTLRDPLSGDESSKLKLAESTIICPTCNKCRCEQCSTPRTLPSKWICSKSIHCGPEPFLDYVTCLCCIKALFYHCGKNHEPDGSVMCADKPCSCAPHRKFWRWGCMTAMSIVFPCLCLYWPCKGCIRVTEKAYQKYHNNGCTCHSSSTVSRRGHMVESSEDEDVFRPPSVAVHSHNKADA